MRNDQEYGQEKYADYDALWHLVSMGILDSEHQPKNWEIGNCGQPTRVAVIDTSVAVDHPNLTGAVNRELALDLFTTRLGAFPYMPPDGRLGSIDFNTDTSVAEGLPAVTDILAELIDRLSHGSPVRENGIQPATSPDFSNHGTAIAGLVGARPVLSQASTEQAELPMEDDPVPLPYSGVDPNCEIIPISTNFDPDPEVMIVAFLYAELIDADVVLLPRDIPDPTRTTPEINQILLGDQPLGSVVSPEQPSEKLNQLWEELGQLMVNVSLNRPIVCAAGNGREEEAIYPANLATAYNGIISVGAVNAKGHPSGYSSSGNLTVLALSNDSEVFDASEVRLDEQRHDYSPIGIPASNANAKFSHYEIISTDVPGMHGYSSSPYRSSHQGQGLREFGSYFCRFGGTSAASALVAGFLALGQSTGRLDPSADGLAKKEWLITNSQTVSDGEIEFRIPVWEGSAHFPDKASATTNIEH